MDAIGRFAPQDQALVPKQASIYERHEQAVRDYHQACRNYAEASALRDKTAAVLQGTTEELAKVMQQAQYDPTVPQPLAQPPMQARY